jgi:hypothetical protein
MVTYKTYKVPAVIVHWSHFGLEIDSWLAWNNVVVSEALIPKNTIRIQPATSSQLRTMVRI